MTVSLNQICAAATLLATRFAGDDMRKFLDLKNRIATGACTGGKMTAEAIVEIASSVVEDGASPVVRVDFSLDMSLDTTPFETVPGELMTMSDREINVLISWGRNKLGINRKLMVGRGGHNIRASHNLLMIILNDKDRQQYRDELNACSSKPALQAA